MSAWRGLAPSTHTISFASLGFVSFLVGSQGLATVAFGRFWPILAAFGRDPRGLPSDGQKRPKHEPKTGTNQMNTFRRGLSANVEGMPKTAKIPMNTFRIPLICFCFKYADQNAA